MFEGFWIVQYEGVSGGGGGVAILTNGRFVGGDSGYAYTGDYQCAGHKIQAVVHVTNFLPGVPSVFGGVTDFVLDLEGTLDATAIRGSATLRKGNVPGLVFKMTKVCDLP